MTTSLSGTAARRYGCIAAALAVAAVTLQAAPASAAPAAPTITAPSGDTGPSVEVTWQPVEDAAGYEVRIDDDPAFGSPEWTSATVNTVSVPTRLLAKGQQHIRVRAKDAAGVWSDWTTSGFTVGTVAGPTLTGPENGITLAQPADPPLLTWAPVAGATTYTIEVDTEDAFVSAATYTTEATALVVPDNQAPGVTYFWRVRADLADGYSTEYSDTREYVVAPIAQPEMTSPSSDDDITDVVLDWTPVAGAKYYELQVDDDVDFGSPEAVPSKIFGTRFSPRTTFGNDQYFWRVRARDLDDNPTGWVRLRQEDHYAFDRVWRDVPRSVHPLGTAQAPATFGDDLYYEWTPVPHASHYELWVSPDPNFTEPTPQTVQCSVAGTTYTPGELTPFDACMPGAEGGTYYWKVRPMDLPYPGGVEGIFSDTQAFVYEDQEAFRITSPVSGSTVTVPTLDWEPVPATEEYQVTLYRGNGSRLTSRRTYSTSFTPMNVEMKPEDGPFRYEINALDDGGRISMTARRSFSLAAGPDSTSPLEPDGAPVTYDAPDLRWGPMAGADHYRIDIGDAVTGKWFADGVAPILTEYLPFPAATDVSTRFLAEGTYMWQVSAYDEEGAELGTGPLGTFTVLPLAPVRGQRLALTGTSLDLDNACAKTLADGADQLCDDVPSTPVLDWDPVPYASEYRVHVSRDGDFTTGALDPTPPRTVNTRWTPGFTYPFKALQESQAQTPYYWFIQPCKSATQCGPDPRSTINPARHAFRKSSPDLELLAPADGALASGTEITFDWRDYFETNAATTYAATGEASLQSAMKYQFQIDDDPAFASPFETVDVDQPTYTSSDRLYPEGTLYWRVQPIDVNDNRLGWSGARTVVKRSPTPTLLSPLVATTGEVPEVSGAVAFRWEAQPFAGSYDIQVAAEADRTFSATNLKVNRSTKRPAFTTGLAAQATLQASRTPYVWRARRVDPSGNKGDWSAVGEFKVVLKQPTLLAPDAGATVGSRGVVLRWSAIAEAAKYRVELRTQGTTSATATTTPATSWAPTTALKVGTSYEWRVAAVDVDGRYSDPGPWRTFTIGGVPTASVPTSIVGTGVFGTTLAAAPPTWNVPGVSNAYQWRRNGLPVDGATGTTYDVLVADMDASITVVVTGTSAEFGTGSSTSAAAIGTRAPGPVATSQPEISGSGRVGSLLTSTMPTWDPAETSAKLQWMRNNSAISGATSGTYTVAPGDLNASITLKVVGELPGRELSSTLSNAITAVEGPAPTATTTPAIQGTPKVGTTLTSTAPTWDPSGVQQTIQWLRGGQPISGQATSSYTVRAEDVDASLTVRYTGTLPGRTTAVVVSAPVTGLLGDAPQATTPPTVSGSRKVGTALTSTQPTWNLPGVQQTIEWLRDGQPIGGQATSSYTVRAEDVDASLTVRYTGTLPGRATATTTSTAVVGLLGDAPQATTTPSVTGSRKVDTTLTSVAPTWHLPGVEQTIQWLRNGRPIDGETGPTYLVRPEDVSA
ncbi:hypothetical protein AAII07_35820, partial [Microvirga sp. 0TCS3.31]